MASKTIHRKWVGSVGVRQGVGMVTEKRGVKSTLAISQAPDVSEPPEHTGANSTVTQFSISMKTTCKLHG